MDTYYCYIKRCYYDLDCQSTVMYVKEYYLLFNIDIDSLTNILFVHPLQNI